MRRRRPGASATKASGRKAAAPARAEKLGLGQLNRHLGYFLRRLQIWVFQDFIQMLGTMKVRPAQYSVLLVIEANPGRSQAAIGQMLGIERARLSRLLHELERRKWIARLASGSDARSHCLHLTADGEKALAKIKSLAEQHEARLIDHLGAKRHTQLMDSLRDFG
ncbi:MAG: MarR family transcriptional regulator [Betaproteobacteria bacterium]|nr:MarR family transcriptional regulator [Betaproteobacteria bacterium]